MDIVPPLGEVAAASLAGGLENAWTSNPYKTIKGAKAVEKASLACDDAGGTTLLVSPGTFREWPDGNYGLRSQLDVVRPIDHPVPFGVIANIGGSLIGRPFDVVDPTAADPAVAAAGQSDILSVVNPGC